MGIDCMRRVVDKWRAGSSFSQSAESLSFDSFMKLMASWFTSFDCSAIMVRIRISCFLATEQRAVKSSTVSVNSLLHGDQKNRMLMSFLGCIIFSF